jgi:IS4 transposase
MGSDSQKGTKIVQLRVEIAEYQRLRLKTQAVRKGLTMGELLERLLDEPLRQLELEALEEAKTPR